MTIDKVQRELFPLRRVLSEQKPSWANGPPGNINCELKENSKADNKNSY